MPKQKDLKRLIRSRMEKTGEAYTAARAQLLKKSEPTSNYAKVGGMSDASVSKATGRTWAQWVGLLDRVGAARKPHPEIAKYVSSLGTPGWWSQMVTVGYERIRGLRDRGQRRGGGYGATKSRTFNVPAAQLFNAFANARQRRRWLPADHRRPLGHTAQKDARDLGRQIDRRFRVHVQRQREERRRRGPRGPPRQVGRRQDQENVG